MLENNLRSVPVERTMLQIMVSREVYNCVGGTAVCGTALKPTLGKSSLEGQ